MALIVNSVKTMCYNNMQVPASECSSSRYYTLLGLFQRKVLPLTDYNQKLWIGELS